MHILYYRLDCNSFFISSYTGVGPVIFVHVLQQNIQPEETAELEPGSDQGYIRLCNATSHVITSLHTPANA